MKRLVITLVAMLALAIVVALPATATSKVTVGPKFQPLTGQPTTFPAGAPFHLENCWLLPLTTVAIGKYSITLDVDRTPQAADFTEFSTPPFNNPLDTTDTLRCWAWNFPNGMSAGTHTFVEHWLAPCYATPGPCSQPNAVVEDFGIFNGSPSLTVVFS